MSTQTTIGDGAQRVAEAWVALVDAGDYDKAWEQAGALLKSQVSKTAFADAVRRAREMFGAIESRSIISRTHETSLPGAPDGEYVVVQAEATFERKRRGVETVTTMKDPDGAWHVSGYFIR